MPLSIVSAYSHALYNIVIVPSHTACLLTVHLITVHSQPHSRSLVPKEDPDTTDVPSVSPLSPPPPSSAKEKQSGREERVKEERKSIEESRQSQVPQFKRRVRVITSDEEFERELRQAGEDLVVVDFTTER